MVTGEVHHETRVEGMNVARTNTVSKKKYELAALYKKLEKQCKYLFQYNVL